MKFQIKITENDYINFNKIHLQNSKTYKKTQKTVKWIMLSILVAIIFMFFYFNTTDSIIVPIVESLIMAFGVLYYVIFMLPRSSRNVAKRNVEMLKKDGKLPFDEKSEIEFCENFFIDKSAHIETRLEYTNIEKLIVTNDYILIYSDSSRASIIPIEQLNDKKDNVIRLLEEKLEKEKIVNKSKLS